jgi:hypothetical protein
MGIEIDHESELYFIADLSHDLMITQIMRASHAGNFNYRNSPRPKGAHLRNH